jgi:hypothetical protein
MKRRHISITVRSAISHKTLERSSYRLSSEPQCNLQHVCPDRPLCVTEQRTLDCTSRTYTTLTAQIHQCCWPTSALDCTNKVLHYYAITNRTRNDLTLSNCFKNKQPTSGQGHCRRMLLKLGKLVGMVTRLLAALDAED